MSKYGVFSGPYFPVFGTEKTLQLDTFHALLVKHSQIVNLTNRCVEKPEIFTSSPCKRKLQQDQEKMTETNKTQIKPKQENLKLKPKQQVQMKKQKTGDCQKNKFFT